MLQVTTKYNFGPLLNWKIVSLKSVETISEVIILNPPLPPKFLFNTALDHIWPSLKKITNCIPLVMSSLP